MVDLGGEDDAEIENDGNDDTDDTDDEGGIDDHEEEKGKEGKELDTGINGEWRHLYAAMSAAPGGASAFFWLGAKSAGAGPSPWRWANGSSPLERSHASWRDEKPEFGRNKCLLMQDIDSFFIRDSWRDYRCTAKFKFVCELHVPGASLDLK